MRRDKFEIYTVTGLVLTIIWLIFALLCFFGGMVTFFNEEPRSFSGWLMWGLFCVLPVIIPSLKFIFGFTRDQTREGERHITITVTEDDVTQTNDGCLYGIIGLLISGFAAVLAGPVVLGFYMFMNICSMITFIADLIRNRG